MVGGLIPRAIRDKRPFEYGKAEAYIPAAQFQELFECLRTNPQEGRQLESYDDNERYENLSFRYIDTSTTYIDCRVFGQYKYPGIHVEVKPLLESSSAPYFSDEYSGFREVPQGYVAFAGRLLQKDAISQVFALGQGGSGVYLCENANGALTECEKRLISNCEDIKLMGHVVRVPLGYLEEYCDMLYKSEDAIAYPSYGGMNVIADAEIPFDKVLSRIENADMIAKGIEASARRIHELSPIIAQQNNEIKEVQEQVQALYDIQ